MVPRPEPLAEESFPEKTGPEPAGTVPRPTTRTERGCLPKVLAERGRVTLAKATSADAVAFCMQSDPDTEGSPVACFAWNLGSDELRTIPSFEPGPAVTDPPTLPPEVRASEDAVSLCDAKDKCVPIVTTKALGKGEQYRRDLESRLLARASSDGKLLALVHVPAGMGDSDSGEIDVWTIAQKWRSKRFRVTSQGHADQVGAVRFLGSLLLVEQCDAGPACTGRLFEPTAGKELLDVPINFYGSELYPLDSTQWVFVDGSLDAVVIVDVTTGRIVRRIASGEAGPMEDAGRVVRDGSGDLSLVYSGMNDQREHPLGGVLIRVSLASNVAPKRYSPPLCGE